MNHEEIKRQALDDMRLGIGKVLTGESASEKLYFIRPNDAIDFLTTLKGVVDMEDFDTNGWQWDFWQTFQYEGRKFILGGDGYYRDYIQFTEQK